MTFRSGNYHFSFSSLFLLVSLPHHPFCATHSAAMQAPAGVVYFSGEATDPANNGFVEVCALHGIVTGMYFVRARLI
jgi:hypothetical protein